ncbi:hypothetical protein NHH03_26335 [Stieleria sp. TO1_6]|uniref:hypothetical protein n=1 Tax=Stieleria tagensis TaxID=2956795 RepID=UPI00209AE731|nr:hypothetical protein [Stieleria tagensis]MCO8125284.1 hypothetical protein [Stieleria tagensis]
MYRFSIGLGLVAVFTAPSVFTSAALAQDQSAQPDAAVSLDMRTIVQVKPLGGRADRLALSGEGIRDPYQAKTQTRAVTVQKTRTEQRTRIVNGQQQTYTVSVPYTEVVEQTYTPSARNSSASSSSPGIPRTINAESVAVWELDGRKLDGEELQATLAQPFVGFYLKQPLLAGQKINPVQRSVLRDDVLLIHWDNALQQVPAEEAPAASSLQRR